MPTFEIAAPDGKKYRVDGPEGSTAQQALERVKAQLGAAATRRPTSADIPQAAPVQGDPGADGRYPSGVTRRTTQADIDNAARMRGEGTNKDGMLGRLLGPLEAVPAIGSGLVNSVIGNLYGVGKSISDGEYGTAKGVINAKRTADEYAARNNYTPRTDTGAAATSQIGGALSKLEGLQGIAAADGVMAGRIAAANGGALRNLAGASAAAQGADDAAMLAQGAPGTLRDLIRNPATPRPGPGARAGSVGAARTAEETLRAEQAAGLPVPLKLTRGMRSRDKSQLAFENIAAKDQETGAPLRNRTVELNQAILDNFDAFTDMTGAGGTPGLREAGRVVDQALVNRVKKVKGEIRQAYDEAAAAGEMQAPAPYKGLTDYLAGKEAEIKTNNAPMLSAVAAKLEKLDPDGTGVIPLKEFEELRKMAGRLSPPGSTSSAFVGDIKTLIDEATEGQGGVKYQQARRLYENYRREFKDAAVIDKMLRVKPGTADRAVALEDIVDHAILKAQSLDDVRKVRNTLTKAGEEGNQAWRELQGETMRQIKERIQTSAKNEAGAREVSPAALDKIVRELDADGRLDFVFTKKGAQQLRDLRDTVQDVKTVPVGTVSSSGTAEVLLAAMDAIVSGTSGLPLPIGTAINYGVKRSKKKKLVRRVDDAVNPDGGE